MFTEVAETVHDWLALGASVPNAGIDVLNVAEPLWTVADVVNRR
jgi:hypothetical protein